MRAASRESRWGALGVLLGAALLLSACTASTTHITKAQTSRTSTSTSGVSTTRTGNDGATEIATAKTVRDELVDAGIRCHGEPTPPPKPDDPIVDPGVAVSLNCTVDGVEISVGVYESNAAKREGVETLRSFACSMGMTGYQYVDGGSWVVGAQPAGQNQSDATMLKRAARAVHAPIREFDCS